MIGVKVAFAALCCLSSYTVMTAGAEPSAQPSAPANTLLNDLKTFVKLAQDEDTAMAKSIMANFEAVGMKVGDAEKAINAMKNIAKHFLDEPLFITDIEDKLPITVKNMDFENRYFKLINSFFNIKSKINYAKHHIKATVIKKDVEKFNTKTNKMETKKEVQYIPATSFQELYLANNDEVSADMDYDDFQLFDEYISKSTGDYMILYKLFEDYLKQRKTGKDGTTTIAFVKPDLPTPTEAATHSPKSPSNTEQHIPRNDSSSAGGVAPGTAPVSPSPSPQEESGAITTDITQQGETTSPTADDTTVANNTQGNTDGPQGESTSQTTQPQTPQGPSSENTPATPEAAAGNLSGSKPSSATFGGITVATLCFMVLSAF
ncbi:merozoite surface antigen-2a1, putative [Babesia ovis]|uniref:Merozoite surface antigen-2a1, putative n=1 Tax=Babesia ovis TaxID=5869 RepID=A0A9W5WW83_BABOV|nr:merozoite surface antigen-2a1, putative [Babesia ovis]